MLVSAWRTCRMGGRTLNVAYAEPKQNEQQAQQQSQAQPKVRITQVPSGSHYTSQTLLA